MRPPSYTPIRRPGARCQWPPDDSWSLQDLVAELWFWRSYSALRPYSGGPEPEPVAVTSVPTPRRELHPAEVAMNAAVEKVRLAREAREQWALRARAAQREAWSD